MSKLTPETLSTILFATADFHNRCEMEKLWKRAPKSDYLIYYFFQTMSAQYLNVVPTSKRQKTMVWACYFTALLKVSWFQNVLLVALCGPKYQRKNLTNSTLPILGQNLSIFFVGILVQTMTPKGHFEINWPLGLSQRRTLTEFAIVLSRLPESSHCTEVGDKAMFLQVIV